MNPLISVITVCYNEAKNIERTCKSMSSQNYQHFEWIVIDGGSKDGTIDILQKYKDKINYLVSEKDAGIYNAMNKGIHQAKGEYLLFLNGGDSLFDENVLYDVVKHIQNDHNSADLYYGEMINRITQENIYPLKFAKINLIFFARIRTLHHQSTFIKANLFNEVGFYDESYRIVADYEWWIRYFIKCNPPKISYLNRDVSYFDPDGVSSRPENHKRLVREAYRAAYNVWQQKDSLGIGFVIKFYIFMIYNRVFNLILDSFVKFLKLLGVHDQFKAWYRQNVKKYIKPHHAQ